MGEGNNKLTETERAIENRENNSSTSTTSGRRRGRPPGTTKQKELLELLPVKEPKVVTVDVPGAEETKPAPKKKAGRPAKKSAPKKVDTTQIKMLLLTASGLLASRPGMEVWNLSLDECEQIAEPLGNILAKNEAFNKATGENADAIALVMAVAMIFIPKFLMYRASKPKKPKQGEQLNYGNTTTTKPRKPQRETRGNVQSVSKQSTTSTENNGQEFGGQLHSIIPAIGGF